MLCYTGLGDETSANEHKERYLRFKADEAAQALTGATARRIRKTTTNGSRFTSTFRCRWAPATAAAKSTESCAMRRACAQPKKGEWPAQAGERITIDFPQRQRTTSNDLDQDDSRWKTTSACAKPSWNSASCIRMEYATPVPDRGSRS